MILTWVSHAAVQPTINQSRHGCKPKPENICGNSKSLPTLATIVVEKLRRGSGLLEQCVAREAAGIRSCEVSADSFAIVIRSDKFNITRGSVIADVIPLFSSQQVFFSLD